MKDLAVVLVSGGMDSCVTVGVARKDYQTALLHINYGQRTEKRELKAFHDIASYYHIPLDKILVANVDFLSKIGGSCLTDTTMEVPEVLQEIHEVPNSYVPFRNTFFLSIAVSWAEVIGARKVFIGAVEQDSPDYPDCKPHYYDVFNKLVKAGTKPATDIEIITPLLYNSKSEIVKLGVSLCVPLHLSWSCYKNDEKACGKCQSCFLRLKAFQEAGVHDPIPYV